MPFCTVQLQETAVIRSWWPQVHNSDYKYAFDSEKRLLASALSHSSTVVSADSMTALKPTNDCRSGEER